MRTSPIASAAERLQRGGEVVIRMVGERPGQVMPHHRAMG